MPDVLINALFVASVAVVAVGAALIYLPAGLIAGGLLTGCTLVVAERGRGSGPPT